MELTKRQIQRLQSLKNHGPNGSLSYDQFRNAMSAPFTSQTLLNAMRGREINPTTYHFLLGILAKHAPEGPAVADGKAAAAGESNESPEAANVRETGQESQDHPTVRGSR